MSSDLVKQALLSLLPEGSAWAVKDGGEWDKTIDGRADNWEYIRAELDKVSEVRNPRTTFLLSDLEREYGVITDETLAEATRRARLAAIVYAPDGVGSASYLQARLREAGFDVYVHSNDPPVDPVPYLDQLFGAQLGEPGFELGEEDALLGSYTSQLIVAGEIAKNEFTFTATCGNPQITCGSAVATCGAATFSIDPIEYPDPTDPDRWRFVFFVGGNAERQIVRDGNMERDDHRYYWSLDSSTNIEKDTVTFYEGTQSLKLSGIPTGTFLSAQTQLVFPEGATTFTLTGRARPAVGAVNVFQSDTRGQLGTVRWNGASSATWQFINTTMNVADGAYITIRSTHFVGPLNIDALTCLVDNAPFGEIQSIANAQIPAERRDEFLRSVLKWKPMHTWGIAIVEWT